MKKMIALMLALIMVMLMVAACGGNDVVDTTDPAATTEATDSTTKATGNTTASTNDTSTTSTTDTTGSTSTTETTSTTTTEPTPEPDPEPKINYDDYLVLWLDFDEWDIDTDIITDITGNGHDAQGDGFLNIADGPDGLGDAVEFTGVGDLLTIKSADDLNFATTDEFTIQFWYKPDKDLYTKSNSSWPCVFQKGEKGDGWYGVWAPKTGIVWGGDAGNIYASTGTNTAWQLVTIVQKNGTVTTYVDGVAGASVGAVDYTSDFDLWIGGKCRDKGADATQQFYGCVDEFKIWSIALDYETITGIEIEKPDEEKAVVSFDFDEIKDGKFIDSVSGLEAVITGDITVGEGKDGNAAVFDAEGAYLTIANNDILNFTRAQNYTIEIVFKMDEDLFNTEDTTGWPCLFQKGGKGTGWYGIWFNKTYIYWGGQAGNYAIQSSVAKDTDGKVTDNGWHKILIVQDATTGTIATYIDGMPGKTVVAQDYTSTYDLWIGGKVGADAIQRFVGSIDQFTIYNYAFDEDAIVEGTLYAAEKAVYEYVDSATGETLSLPYRVYYPSDYDAKDSKTYPILFFLHGNGECGTDNEQQIKVLGGSNILLENVANMDNCIIVAPQCVDDNGITKEWIEGEPWSKGIYERAELPETTTLGLRAASALLDEFLAGGKVDLDRVYGAGISMGGYGIWELMARRPETFAACVPVCGSGITGSAADLVNIDIWAFHGDADTTVNISGTKAMYDAITAAGGTKMTFTILAGVTHNAWTPAYTTVNEDGLTPAQWLLKQTKAD